MLTFNVNIGYNITSSVFWKKRVKRMINKFKITYITIHGMVKHSSIKVKTYEEAISLLMKNKHELIYQILDWKKK